MLSYPEVRIKKPLAERIPDHRAADSRLPIRIEFNLMRPMRDPDNEKQVNIRVQTVRVFLTNPNICIVSFVRLLIKRTKGQLRILFDEDQAKRIIIGQDLLDAMIRHLEAHPLVGKFCLDETGKGALGKWRSSEVLQALRSSRARN